VEKMFVACTCLVEILASKACARDGDCFTVVLYFGEHTVNHGTAVLRPLFFKPYRKKLK